MGNKQSCEICQDEGDTYNNPLIKFFHIGRYNNRVWCISCLLSRTLLKDKDCMYPVIYIS